ncbi:hypothetical protein KPH14_005610 [Odynerus spinipes]|uniref:BHLH domain-containing protein n=1 Tax=Odynerus spinipes TaxID=1348599 RepID=A0AAD9VJQ5_9HYME|nr:hypothetical protein KPH14_005610 [Odynerus spinipes]
MSGHVVETTSELSAFMKAGVMAGSERDAGFCSGGDEDDMSGLHSPSASEDSVEVQVIPISLRNKRKLAEPRKIQEPSTAPLKKRRFEQIEETVVADEESRAARSPSPFRPWSSTSNKSNETKTTTTTTATSTASSTTTPSNGNVISTIVSTSSSVREEKEEDEETRRRQQEARIQEVALLRLRESNRSPDSPIQARNAIPRRETRQRFEQSAPTSPPAPLAPGIVLPSHPKFQEEPLALVLRGEIPRVPSHPAVSGTYDRTSSSSSSYPVDGHHHQQESNHHHHHHHNHHHHPAPPHQQQNHQGPATQQTNHSRHHQGSTGSGGGGGQQRNYKNMTRERRIEANARERTRVHTISAAFDTLRRAIPAYSHNQKLSKLSVLRIACSYIMTLSKIANTPEGEPTTGASLGACVDLVSRTIQTEGKLRKRKDD